MSRQNYLIRLAFCGTAYHGFQVQKNAVTVCGVLQNAMEKVLGERVPVKGCSRTDAGVHARGFCVSFFADMALPMEKLPLAFNANLPPDVRVFHAQTVPENFHARYTATEKEYRYVILNSSMEDAFVPHLSYRVAGELDAAAMDDAARRLVGRHDFQAFMTGDAADMDTVRTITRAQVVRRGPYVVFAVAADGFLYNMVRILAGTLLQIGQGKQTHSLATIIESQNRAKAGDTLPARGLYLNYVVYPGIESPPNSQGPFAHDLFSNERW